MYRDVILKNIVAVLGIDIRPRIKLDGKAVGYSAVAQVFAVSAKSIGIGGVTVYNKGEAISAMNRARLVKMPRE